MCVLRLCIDYDASFVINRSLYCVNFAKVIQSASCHRER